MALLPHPEDQDSLGGAENIEKAISKREKIHRLLASDGFILRKYQSNCPEVLANINEKLIEKNSSRSLTGKEFYFILGLNWHATEDMSLV